MATKNPRIHVTLDPEDLEIIMLLSQKKKMSLSAVVKKMVEDWLEEYEDMKLMQRIEKREKNTKYISHEEYWNID